MKLEKLGEFVSGINPSRLMSDAVVYSQSMFDSDLELSVDNCSFKTTDIKDIYVLKKDDVVIRTVIAKAAIVSDEHTGAVLTANYIKANLLSDLIYYKYFVYIFNCNKEVAKQLATNVQGIATTRITTLLLKDIDIFLPPLETQKKIGDLYFEILKLKNMYKNKAKQLEALVTSYCELLLINGGNDYGKIK